MSNTVEAAFGTKLVKLMSGSESENTEIGFLTNVGELGIESEEIDVTSHSSADGYREFLPSLKDGGEVTLEGWIVTDDSFDTLYALADSQSVEEWYVELPNDDVFKFKAFVKMAKKADSGIEDANGFTATLRISGKPTYNEYTPSV